MQNITVEIKSKGFTGLNAENIEKALLYYFSSPTLKVSFSVTEKLEVSKVCPNCDRDWQFHDPRVCSVQPPSR